MQTEAPIDYQGAYIAAQQTIRECRLVLENLCQENQEKYNAVLQAYQNIVHGWQNNEGNSFLSPEHYNDIALFLRACGKLDAPASGFRESIKSTLNRLFTSA